MSDFLTNAQGRKPRPLAGIALQKAQAWEFEYQTIARTGVKTCRDCTVELPITNFYAHSRQTKRGETRTYYYTRCIACHTSRTSDWGKKNTERRRAINRKSHQKNHYQAKNYGITPARYEEMVLAQNALCAICGQPEVRKTRLSIDHDHITNVVRELLCDRCNNILGRAKDDPEILRGAAAYLDRHREIHVLELLCGK